MNLIQTFDIMSFPLLDALPEKRSRLPFAFAKQGGVLQFALDLAHLTVPAFLVLQEIIHVQRNRMILTKGHSDVLFRYVPPVDFVWCVCVCVCVCVCERSERRRSREKQKQKILTLACLGDELNLDITTLLNLANDSKLILIFYHVSDVEISDESRTIKIDYERGERERERERERATYDILLLSANSAFLFFLSKQFFFLCLPRFGFPGPPILLKGKEILKKNKKTVGATVCGRWEG